MDDKYTWIGFYKELANKLLEYKSNRQELISIIKRSHSDNGIKMAKMESDGSIIDVDPFSVFGLFNKQISEGRRKILTAEFAKRMNLTTEPPTNFDGLPVLNNMNATFFMFYPDRGEQDIENLWNLFEYAMKYAKEPNETNKEQVSKYFDVCVNLKHNGNSKITMGLFWIAPEVYINLDSRNKWYIYDSKSFPNGLIEKLPDVVDKIQAKDYFEILESIREYIKTDDRFNDFVDLSYEAWRYSTEVNKNNKEKALTDEEDYWPSLKEYDPNIPTEQWIQLLHDETVLKPINTYCDQ